MSVIIKELRDSTGLSQKQFADHFEIPVSTLRKWEQGEAKPAHYVEKMLAMLLPALRKNMTKIISPDGTVFFFDKNSNTLFDSEGNSIHVGSDITKVKPENLPLYVSDLFESFHAIINKFDRDCEYDTKEDIIWS